MPIYNSEIADKFRKTADLLEIKGANEFKVRAYRNAARIIERESKSFQDLAEKEKDFTKYKGIGSDISSQIHEIINTGTTSKLENLKKEIPETLTKIMDIEGMGPKSVKKLYENLDIKTMSDLEDALDKENIKELEGFGKKSVQQIKEGIENFEEREGERTLLKNAEEYIEPLKEYLQKSDHINKIAIAGSYRRKKETIGDIDVLATSNQANKAMDHFVEYSDIEEVVSKGETKSTVKLRTGLQIDLRVVKDESYGAALVYFTGSKSHNIALRDLAMDKDWKVNEYGIFDKDENKIAGKTEEEVYTKLGLEYIAPELRENRGEVKAANEENLPDLVKLVDIKGDLQMHSDFSDGNNSIEEMAKAAKELKREYIAITDHSSYVGITQGLKKEDIDDYIEEIKKVDENFENIKVLSGVEVDIMEDGSLDLSDESLEKFDIVVCSIHSKFDLPKDKQTQRIIKAIENHYTKIFAHPTGRKIQERKPYQFDMEAVFETVKKHNCYMEINAHPIRLDLDDIKIKNALEQEVKLIINTDAHSTSELQYMKYGINQARRGWAEKEDIINTQSYEKFI